MLGITVLKDTLSIINILVSTAVIVIVAFVGVGAYRKSVFDNQKAINDTLKELTSAQEKQIANQDIRIETIEKGYRVQEQRIMRVETDAQRNGRLLNSAREEIRMLETVVQIAIPTLAKSEVSHPDEYNRIISVMAELSEYRRRSTRDHDEWEQTQLSLQVYNDAKAVRDEVTTHH